MYSGAIGEAGLRHPGLPDMNAFYCYALLLKYAVEPGAERTPGRTPFSQLKILIDSARAKIVSPA